MNISRALAFSASLVCAATTTALAQPIIEPDRLSVDYGDREPEEGATVIFEVDVFARGDQPLTIGQIGDTDPLDSPFFAIGLDTCSGTTLLPSQHCDFDVTLRNAPVGVFNDTFNIPSNDPAQPSVTIDVRVRILEDILNGRLQGFLGSALQVCESVDTGATHVTVLSDPVEWNCGTSPINLGPQERFHARVIGVAAGATFNEDAFPTLPHAVIAGRRVDVTVRPSPLDFGNLMMVEDETVEQITVRNGGDSAVFVSEVATTDRLLAPFGVITDNCSFATLGRGSTCTLIVRFDESDTSGAFAETFSITVEETDGTSEVLTVPVSGSRNGVILGARAFGALERDYYCYNITTGQFRQESGAIANCRQLGFDASPGDLVQLGVVGITNE